MVNHFRALLGMADIHLLPQRADAADLVMPSKLIGMFASGRPVLATAHLGTDTRYQMGESARHYAETHLHVDAVLGRFVTRLEQDLLLNW